MGQSIAEQAKILQLITTRLGSRNNAVRIGMRPLPTSLGFQGPSSPSGRAGTQKQQCWEVSFVLLAAANSFN